MYEALYLNIDNIDFVVLHSLSICIYSVRVFAFLQEREDRKEFSMGAVCISDASGIAVAGAIAVPLHNFLCTL